MKKIGFAIIIFVLSCNKTDFFEYTSFEDAFRLPIIDSVEILSSDGKNGWTITENSNLHLSDQILTSYSVDSICKTSEYVLFKCEGYLHKGKNYKMAWLVFSAHSKLGKVYLKEDDFLKISNCFNQIKFASIKSVFSEFKKTPNRNTINKLILRECH